MDTADDREPVYRRASIGDLEAIAALEAEIFSEPYLQLMLRQLFELHGSQWLVAELDGLVIGYALTLVRDRRSLLFTYAVHRPLRNRGFGRALLDHAMRCCSEAGANEMELTVRPDNQPAFNIFKAANFQSIGYDDQYFGPGEPRRVMKRRLERG
ncbi:GNAT family N-acetyltransferase [Nocardia jiangxiensis]|uniref:GNAT family N-acetyltransferase n=1 Tax=Nocardia jiangxiensis TaxID=282685 RepID=A0ABW6S7R7_9NOCA|nr:GNAT family N-acetyltransferase [Nocardia jiangxiensis]